MTASEDTELVFLAALAKTGRKLKAATVAGVTAQWYRDKAKRDPEFAKRMALATMTLHEAVEDVQVEALLHGDRYEVISDGVVVELRKPAPPQMRLKYLEQFVPGWSGASDEAFAQAKELMILGADGNKLSMKEIIQQSLVSSGAPLTPTDEQDEDENDDE